MDPITITTSIISSILTIKLWLDNKDKKDKAIKNLSTAVNLVYLILSPLEDPDKARVLHPSVVASLLSVGEVLSRIKDHLSIWKDKHRASVTKLLGFISPSSVVMDLHDDALLLSQHVQTISFALHVSTFLAGHDNLAEKPEPVPDKPMLLGLIKNVDVRLFWEDVIGEKTLYVPRADFHQALTKWLGNADSDFSDPFFDMLLFRIDEFGVGGVTPSGLDRFVGERTLREAIYQLKDQPRPAVNPQTDHTGSNSSPWLVWIDDNPSNNTTEVEFAHRKGVTVFHFYSTASAKAWIVANEAELRLKEESNLLRFITDNARWESGGGDDDDNNTGQVSMDDTLNLSAGAQILRFLRSSQGYTAPVLVYCWFTIDSTSYIHSYPRAGSTTQMNVVLAFIEALATGVRDDGSWEGVERESALSGLLG